MSRHVRVSLSSVSPVSHRGIILRLLFGTIQVEKEDRKKKKKRREKASSVRKENHIHCFQDSSVIFRSLNIC